MPNASCLTALVRDGLRHLSSLTRARIMAARTGSAGGIGAAVIACRVVFVHLGTAFGILLAGLSA
ncbi:hypothetical protein GCM10020218_024390 [Dactylosporangium vinaceum]